jgi:hypothetical protein
MNMYLYRSINVRNKKVERDHNVAAVDAATATDGGGLLLLSIWKNGDCD